LARHLSGQVGRTVSALIERSGLARAEDFTEIAFAGEGEPGRIVRLTVTHTEPRRAVAGAPHP
jgi:threonylcarbamoyladenosine tRNA methylthiotransferase MtaB